MRRSYEPVSTEAVPGIRLPIVGPYLSWSGAAVGYQVGPLERKYEKRSLGILPPSPIETTADAESQYPSLFS